MISIAYTLGRILVPIVFIVSGVQNFFNVGDVAKILEDSRLPVPDAIAAYLGGMPRYVALGYLVSAIEVIAGLMVLAGLAARWGALILIVFTAGTIFFVHHFWDMEGAAAAMSQTQALYNLSILGGLLLIVGIGSHAPALDGRPVI
jgi:putative oxidoreductase